MALSTIGDRYCKCGTHVSAGASCPTCGSPGGAPDGIGGSGLLIIVGWLVLLLSAPVYPFAGGAALLATLAVTRLAGTFEFSNPLVLVPVIAATLLGFWGGYKIEKPLSKFAAYRLVRDLLRFSAGSLLIFGMLQAQGERAKHPAEIVGAIILFPIVLFILKRLDRALKLDKVENDPDSDKYREPKERPQWLLDLGQKVNFRNAAMYGFVGGVIGFVVGREAAIFTALLGWVIVTTAIIVFSGGFTILRAINERIGGLLFKIAVGAPLGALVGGLFSHYDDMRPTPEGMATGAVAGVAVLVVWGVIFRKRAS